MPQLESAGWQVSVCTRSGLPEASPALLPHWICVAPLWVLPEYFPLLLARGARHVVVLSSTSVFTKADSADASEQAVAARLREGEQRLQSWAEAHGLTWVALRPTLIYGRGRDKNVSEVARLIRRWGFFPLLGRAAGLRQPVHAEDVAQACVAALLAPAAVNHAYALSGGETLTYREMVTRIFKALGKSPRRVTVPLGLFRLALKALRLLPRYRHWTLAMAQRMNEDLVFDHDAARRDLGFTPRAFVLPEGDLP
jgi:nucleoside-diphosphate-sugar epimerase